MGASVKASVTVISTMTTEIAVLAEALEAGFEQHPAAKVIRSLPGLGTILGARVLGEFGDDPNRYASSSRATFATSVSPTRSTSGRSPRSPRHQEHGPSMTPIGRPATRTTRRFEHSGTVSSASFTAASRTAASTTSTPPGATGPTTQLRWPPDKLIGPWDI
jgi:hypothetical protein